MAKKKKKQKLVERLKSKYRLTILNENTFSEKFSVLLSPLNVITILLLFLIVFGGLVYSVVAYTPLKQYVIPGYTDEEYRAQASYSRYVVDSLLRETQRKELYLTRLNQFMNGEIVELDFNDSAVFDTSDLNLDYNISSIDSVLRNKVAEETDYEVKPSAKRESGLKNIFLFKPLNGTVSSEFDAKIRHFGIDLIAPKSTVIKSVLDGTVIMSTYTTNDGHVISVQHDHNLVSIYKHNSSVFKQIGDAVKAGDAIAVIGDSGENSDGPHLHFELWLKGVPVDPMEYFSFDK